jgi:hypothetical protein
VVIHPDDETAAGLIAVCAHAQVAEVDLTIDILDWHLHGHRVAEFVACLRHQAR